jgi:hypothetical protein
LPFETTEYAARNAADIAWMEETFAVANTSGSVAVMFISQADPGFDLTGSLGVPPFRNPRTLREKTDASGSTDTLIDGYQSFLVALREEVIAFRKPVAFVHGDSHYFRVDRPMQDSTGLRLENFTRVETFGDNAPTTNDVNWVKVLVDPKSREVFSYQAQIVPGNRVAVAAP